MEKVTLRMLRAKHNLSQKQAAEKVGVKEQTWFNWENEKTFPDVRKVARIEQEFGVNYNDIIFFTGNHGFTVKKEQHT